MRDRNLETALHKGQTFEATLADVFRNAGYKVTKLAYEQRPFRLLCVKGDDKLAIQAKTGKRATPPKFQHAKALASQTPYDAKRVYWYHCYRYDQHTVWEITAHGLALVPNPLAHMLPPPLDKNTVNRLRRCGAPTWTACCACANGGRGAASTARKTTAWASNGTSPCFRRNSCSVRTCSIPTTGPPSTRAVARSATLTRSSTT